MERLDSYTFNIISVEYDNDPPVVVTVDQHEWRERASTRRDWLPTQTTSSHECLPPPQTTFSQPSWSGNVPRHQTVDASHHQGTNLSQPRDDSRIVRHNILSSGTTNPSQDRITHLQSQKLHQNKTKQSQLRTGRIIRAEETDGTTSEISKGRCTIPTIECRNAPQGDRPSAPQCQRNIIKSTPIRAKQTDCYTNNEIELLLTRAVEFLTQSRYYRTTETEWLSRNGPIAYFKTSVMTHQRGKLTRNLKDRSGHIKNPLNGQYRGIFFMANVDRDGMPKDYSPYGPLRLMMPSYDLLKDCALFFADFYCLKPNTKHYVQIVAVKPHTTEYQFCKEYLTELATTNNRFLHINHSDQTVVFNYGVWVEVMYSHDLDLNHWLTKGAYFYDVNSTGVKSKKGLLKYEDCQRCEI